MALNPFADYFNHNDIASADASFGPNGYVITTSRDIGEGEEVYISYGNHSNDFLLAEYGFVMESNQWDEVLLDDFVLPLFDGAQKKKLKEMGFFGKYVLDAEGVCYRTQIALRLLCLPANQWQRLVSSGLGGDDKHQSKVDIILLKVFKSFLETAYGKLESLKVLDCGLPSQRETLGRRWSQLRQLVLTTMRRIESLTAKAVYPSKKSPATHAFPEIMMLGEYSTHNLQIMMTRPRCNIHLLFSSSPSILHMPQSFRSLNELSSTPVHLFLIPPLHETFIWSEGKFYSQKLVRLVSPNAISALLRSVRR